MGDVRKSRRGVYYDLEKSPYTYSTPYGDSFKFPSQKKLDMYSRDVSKEVERVDNVIARNGLSNRLPDEIIRLIRRQAYSAFYDVFIKR